MCIYMYTIYTHTYILSTMREKYFGLIWKAKTATEEHPKAVVAQLRTAPPGKAPASYSQEGGRIYSFRYDRQWETTLVVILGPSSQSCFCP